MERIGLGLAVGGACFLTGIFLIVLAYGTWPQFLQPLQDRLRLISDLVGPFNFIVEVLIFVGPGLLIAAVGQWIQNRDTVIRPFQGSRPERVRLREPIFNIAPAVVGLAGALLAIHVIREWVLSGASDLWITVAFAFIPAREFAEGSLAALPGGDAARLWSPLTYALLHANWTHVLVNDLWLVAFGSPLAWRFGTARFLVFSAAGAIAGALLHLAFYPGDTVPMVGASAAISAHMAGVSRFAFVPGAPIFGGRGSLYHAPAPPLSETIRNPRVLAFIGVWFGVNLLFGITGLASGVASGAIAWDAHLGGFAAGLVLFSLFDRF